MGEHLRILLFEDGRPGEIMAINGENVQAELEELLGGEIEMKRLNNRLQLVVHKDGEKLDLPMRYTRHKPGHVPELIYGNAAVVRVGQDGQAHGITKKDAEEVNLYLHVAEV